MSIFIILSIFRAYIEQNLHLNFNFQRVEMSYLNNCYFHETFLGVKFLKEHREYCIIYYINIILLEYLLVK